MRPNRSDVMLHFIPRVVINESGNAESDNSASDNDTGL